MLSILIVEDNSINQKVLDAYLRKKGIRTIVAKNGLEAISQYKKEKFDCILMDIAMPEMDGITATKSIRKLERKDGNYTPIIAVTASDPNGNRDIILASGIDDLIAKPIEEDNLKQKIWQYCGYNFD